MPILANLARRKDKPELLVLAISRVTRKAIRVITAITLIAALIPKATNVVTVVTVVTILRPLRKHILANNSTFVNPEDLKIFTLSSEIYSDKQFC